MNKPVLRLCEWGSVATGGILLPAQREAIAQAAQAWKTAHHLPVLPLLFHGPNGETLTARQYVGVVEAGGASIEIYPKLDAALIDAQTVPTAMGQGVLANLLWLLAIADGDPSRDADTASLAEAETPFVEMFALLLARCLRRELIGGGGPVRRYEAHSGDLRAVRGRVQLGAQVTRHWNRMDTIACAWDEFSPDNPLNQALRCACRTLRDRVSGAQARWLLTDCLEMLSDVEDVSVVTALHRARQIRHFDRTMERFRLTFELAVRLLSGTGQALRTDSTETFTFLVDMNDLFERYVHAVLQAAFGVPVRRQAPVWHLFPHLARGRIAQKPDFSFTDRSGTPWIGDAKYKHLARGQSAALRFVASGDETDAGEAAGRRLSPDDVRQLTVYAELERRTRSAAGPAHLLLLYPFVGEGELSVDRAIAWNGSLFHLAPLRMAPAVRLTDNLPPL